MRLGGKCVLPLQDVVPVDVQCVMRGIGKERGLRGKHRKLLRPADLEQQIIFGIEMIRRNGARGRDERETA